MTVHWFLVSSTGPLRWFSSTDPLVLVLVSMKASHTHTKKEGRREVDLPASLLKLDVGLLSLVGLEVHTGLEAVHLEGLVDAALRIQV